MNYQLVNDYLTSIFNNVLVIEESSLRGSQFKDVSIKEMHTIDVIGTMPNATPSDISKELLVTLGTVTTSLNNLERKGYIERRRSSIDRRVVHLSLTKKGRLLYRLHKRFHNRMVMQVVEGMSPEEKMNYARITQVAHYAPEQIVTNDDLAKIIDTSDEWISSRTGIKQRHLSRTESTSDLATKVAEQLLEKAQLSADQLDFIIVATITPDSMMPSTAARVQANIGAAKAFAFDLTAACSGFIFALSTGEKFISSGRYQRGLVIGSETLSKVVDWSDRATSVLFGDGAGGVLLEAAEKQHFWAESQFTDGLRGQSLTCGGLGLSSPFSEKQVDDRYLKMEGRAIFDFAIRDVAQSIKNTIEESPFSVEELDYRLLHQANIRILDKMAKKLGVSREKLPANMMEYGNTSAASIPILLSECVQQDLIKLNGDQTILLSGFGGGLTWGTLIVTI